MQSKSLLGIVTDAISNRCGHLGDPLAGGVAMVDGQAVCSSCAAIGQEVVDALRAQPMDYADLEKRLRERTVAVNGPAGVFTTVLRREPDTLCVEAADALSSLTRELEGDPYGAGFDAAREVIATYVALNFDNGIELAAQIRGVQPLLSTAPADNGSEGV